jgi:hypothetical protein
MKWRYLISLAVGLASGSAALAQTSTVTEQDAATQGYMYADHQAADREAAQNKIQIILKSALDDAVKNIGLRTQERDEARAKAVKATGEAVAAEAAAEKLRATGEAQLREIDGLGGNLDQATTKLDAIIKLAKAPDASIADVRGLLGLPPGVPPDTAPEKQDNP